MHLPILQDLLVLLGFSAVVVFVLQRLKLPSILGFLITGVLIGPYGLALVKGVHEVEVISELGVILLLFVIGMELSIRQLIAIKRTVFLGGAVQVGLTVAVTAYISRWLGMAWNEAVFVGFLFSLSSTAIVLKVLQDRDEMAAPHGRNALGLLIFQDIIVVPMMLLTPILAGQSDNVTKSLLLLLVKTVVVVGITVVSARYLVPRLMHAIAKTKSKELFLISTITICFAVAFLTSEVGLSLGLGAFMAGLIISESEYSHQATSSILPFRELFTSFFFVSVGMLMDMQFFLSNFGVIIAIVLAVFVIKSLIAALAIAVLRYPARTILLTGLSLFQVGEFAFILSKTGIEYGLLDEQTNQYFLAVSIVSMFLTPFVIMFSEHIAVRILRLQPVRAFDKRFSANISDASGEPKPVDLDNHLVIIGYGINGSNLAKASEYSDIPYIVLELNPETVQEEQANGIPIVYGDASQPHILEMAHVTKARAVVIAISDPVATKAIIHNVRDLSQSVYLLVRTRFVKETTELLALGADDVIPEEFETSVQIFSRVLHNFLVPEGDIEHFVERIRSDNYEVFQSQRQMPRTFRPTAFPSFHITCLRVNTEDSDIVGVPLQQLNLRANYGINILGITRNEETLDQIGPDEVLRRDDRLYLSGQPIHIETFRKAIN
jgi:CPA2 family monovalent cation:H+ antiporter-2